MNDIRIFLNRILRMNCNSFSAEQCLALHNMLVDKFENQLAIIDGPKKSVGLNMSFWSYLDEVSIFPIDCIGAKPKHPENTLSSFCSAICCGDINTAIHLIEAMTKELSKTEKSHTERRYFQVQGDFLKKISIIMRIGKDTDYQSKSPKLIRDPDPLMLGLCALCRLPASKDDMYCKFHSEKKGKREKGLAVQRHACNNLKLRLPIVREGDTGEKKPICLDLSNSALYDRIEAKINAVLDSNYIHATEVVKYRSLLVFRWAETHPLHIEFMAALGNFIPNFLNPSQADLAVFLNSVFLESRKYAHMKSFEMKGFIDPNLPDNDITIKIQKALNFADDENIVLASIFQEAKRISLCNLIKLASSTSKKVNALVESSHFDDLTDIDSPKSKLAELCLA